MIYVFCVNIRDSVNIEDFNKEIRKREIKIANNSYVLDSNEPLQIILRTPIQNNTISDVTYINILITNKKINLNDNIIYELILNGSNYKRFLDFINAYKITPYCELTVFYKIQKDFCNNCKTCVNLKCKYRTSSFLYNNTSVQFKNIFKQYIRKIIEDVDKMIFEPRFGLFDYLYESNKINNTDYLIRVFINQYYNNRIEMASFLCNHINLIHFYEHTRIIPLEEILMTKGLFSNEKYNDF